MASLASVLAYALVLAQASAVFDSAFSRAITKQKKATTKAFQPRVTLVSYGTGDAYEQSLHALEKAAPAMGFHRTFMWSNEAQLQKAARGTRLEDVHGDMDKYGRFVKRPFCAAFKSVILLEAMKTMPDGEFIMWADASKYYDYSRLADEGIDIRLVIAALQRAGGDGSSYGLMACPRDCSTGEDCMSNGSRGKTANATLLGFSDLIGDDVGSFMKETHVLNSQILFRVSRESRQLIQDWFDMALDHPEAFCTSHPQDQVAWSILTRSRGLPLVDICQGLKAEKVGWPCHQTTKSAEVFLSRLQKGLFVLRTWDNARELKCDDPLK